MDSSDRMLVCDINMTMHDGGETLLTGPNGSGKTTFFILRVLTGFIKPLLGDGYGMAMM